MTKSPKIKLMSALGAITLAKENSKVRKIKAGKALFRRASEAIAEMVENGVVECFMSLTQEEYVWGGEFVEAELTGLGYVVTFPDEHPDDQESTPDMTISIAHLK